VTPVWPAALAAIAVVIAVGLPASRPVLLPPRARPLPLPTAAAPLVVGLGVLVVHGAVGAVVAAGGTWAGRRALAERAAARRRRLERSQATEATMVLAAELRAGRLPADALAVAAEIAAGTTRAALASAAAAARFGADPVPGLLQQAETSPVPELLRGLAACWQVCAGTGSSLAAAVDRLDDGLRAELRQRDLVETETAGASASAALLAGLPVMGLLLAQAAGADPLRVLLHTPVGVVCLVLGLALDLLGLWWTRWMIGNAVRGL